MNPECTVVVVIPVHTATPTSYELISFAQCFAILHRHSICVVAPIGLSLAAYQKVVKRFDVKFMDAKWFTSVLAYNKLKLSRSFYNLFNNYEFLLTYELDAFVFRDELEQWCQKGFDYIGAPWFAGHDKPGQKLSGVGNSGFSLRRIDAVKKVLKKMYAYSNTYQKTPPSFWQKLKLLGFKLLSIGGENYSVQRFPSLYEDHFLCEVAAAHNPAFRVAPVNEAIRFSFETKPATLFAINNNQLPMGCHAWWRYDAAFWKPYIESFGYRLTPNNEP